MKLKCPVALCGWEGKSHQFHKHIEDYKIEWKGVMDSGFPRAEAMKDGLTISFQRYGLLIFLKRSGGQTLHSLMLNP